MSQRRTLSFLAPTLLLALVSFDSAAQLTAAPIRRIDHIMIRADAPAKVYAFFTEILQLPVAWPLMSPTRYQEITRFPAIEGKTWNHPAISDGILLIRNIEEMAAFDLRR